MNNLPHDLFAKLSISKYASDHHLVDLKSDVIEIGNFDPGTPHKSIVVEKGRISIDDPTIKGTQAKIFRDYDGAYRLENVGSSDITMLFLDGTVKNFLSPKGGCLLNDGNAFLIGVFRLEFSLEQAKRPAHPTTHGGPGVETHLRSEDITYLAEKVVPQRTPVEPQPTSAKVESTSSSIQREQVTTSPPLPVPSSPPPATAPSSSTSVSAATSTSVTGSSSAPPVEKSVSDPAPKVEPLPNGSVGTPYRHSIPQPQSGRNFDYTFSSEIGLKVEMVDGNLVLNGIPSVSGHHTLTLKFDAPEKPGRSVEYAIFLNPDPRSLWKDLPSDPNLPYQKSTHDSECVSGPKVRLVAASVRGRSHAHEGTFRDDHFLISHDDGWHFLAVSDGAGSAKFSRKGSAIACETVWQQTFAEIGKLDQILLQQPESGIQAAAKQGIGGELYRVFGNAGRTAFQNINHEANEPSEDNVSPAKINDFAATLIYCVFKKFKFGWFIAAFAVGDGGVAVYRRERGVKILNKADGGEYAGQTRFATMPHIWESEEQIRTRIQVDTMSDFTAIVAMTDGVSDPKFGTEKNFGDTKNWHQFWDDVSQAVDWKSPAADEQWLKWLDFWSAGNHDDRTIAIGVPH